MCTCIASQEHTNCLKIIIMAMSSFGNCIIVHSTFYKVVINLYYALWDPTLKPFLNSFYLYNYTSNDFSVLVFKEGNSLLIAQWTRALSSLH